MCARRDRGGGTRRGSARRGEREGRTPFGWGRGGYHSAGEGGGGIPHVKKARVAGPTERRGCRKECRRGGMPVGLDRGVTTRGTDSCEGATRRSGMGSEGNAVEGQLGLWRELSGRVGRKSRLRSMQGAERDFGGREGGGPPVCSGGPTPQREEEGERLRAPECRAEPIDGAAGPEGPRQRLQPNHRGNPRKES